MRIKQVMTSPAICAEVPGNRTDVLHLMIRHHISGVPVVREGTMKLAGIVSRNDIFNNTGEEQIAMIMTSDVVSVTPNSTIISAVRKFLELGFNHLPVVDHGEVVGIVTPTNLLPLVAANGETTVHDCISGSCVPLHRATPLGAALRIMRLSGARAMPVLGKRGLLCGIVTDRDLFDATDIREGVSVSEMGVADDEDPWSWDGLRDIMRIYHSERRLFLPDVPVEKIMIEEVVTAFYGSPASSIAQIMLDGDYGQVPLVDAEGKLTGMIYCQDLLKVLLTA